MKKKVKLLLMFSLLVFSLGAGPCENNLSFLNKDKNNSKSMHEYTGPMVQIFDTNGRFSISAPPTWRTVRKNQNPYLFILAPGAGDNGPMSNVVIEPMNKSLGPYAYLQANIVSMKTSIRGLAFVEGGIVNVNGINIAWIHYTYQSASGPVEAITYCQTRDLRAFSVTSLAPQKIFPIYQDIFQKIGHSLKIN
jgi:hypothetical protein